MIKVLKPQETHFQEKCRLLLQSNSAQNLAINVDRNKVYPTKIFRHRLKNEFPDERMFFIISLSDEIEILASLLSRAIYYRISNHDWVRSRQSSINKPTIILDEEYNFLKGRMKIDIRFEDFSKIENYSYLLIFKNKELTRKIFDEEFAV